MLSMYGTTFSNSSSKGSKIESNRCKGDLSNDVAAKVDELENKLMIQAQSKKNLNIITRKLTRIN